MTPSLIAAPAIEPIALADAKAWLRVDANDDDALIQALIVSARMTLEAFTRRFFVTQTWRLAFDAWPTRPVAPNLIALPFAPFQSVAAMRTFDTAGAAQTVPPASYRAPPATNAARIVFASAPPAPGRETDGVEIDIAVGYGATATDTPEPLRRAMLLLVAQWHENRGDAPASGALPGPAAALAAPYRRGRLL